MTCREKLKIEHPEYVNEIFSGGCCRCPHYYGYLTSPYDCSIGCDECWDREIPEEKTEEEKLAELVIDKINEVGTPNVVSKEDVLKALKESDPSPIENPHILDSGNRREFESGAVRDIQEGKGRCDLLPLDIAAEYLGRFCIADGNLFDNVLHYILLFQNSGKVGHLYLALNYANPFPDAYTMILEVAKQFEEGAKKYGERNWEKGIPVHCYIDSAIRHYMKYKRGDKDEPHDRAVCWNLMCAIWTCKNKPELNEYAAEEREN